ncbi:hypothetical protein ABZW38_16725 [Streptomyces bacillaris]|uniref:hypothetical protein n=1 Tax=Streptomyces bacillaris TaxID=68179 RepID=UPI003460294C
MPLNVPVAITVPPTNQTFTVHTDRQRWSVEQLAAAPDGRAAQVEAVREGVRRAASTCTYAQLTQADYETVTHPDGSVTVTGRVLCDEADCYAAAQRHHFDDAEKIEAKAATDWLAGKKLSLPRPEEIRVKQVHVLSEDQMHQHRSALRFLIAGLLCTAISGALSLVDYTKPEGTSPGNHITVWVWTNVDSLADFLTPFVLLGGIVLIGIGAVRLATLRSVK